MLVPPTEPREGPQRVQFHVAFDGTQSMEGQAEGASSSTLENQAVEDGQASVMDFEDGGATSSNGITTGGGEEGIIDSREKRDTAVLGVGGGDGSSNMAKKRKIGEEGDENPKLNDNVNVVNRGSNRLPWSRTLCGSLTGEEEQEPEFSLFDERIRLLWKAHGIEVEYIMKKPNNKGFYIFKFNTRQGMLDALAKGPWTLNGDVQIVLKSWGPGHFPPVKPKGDIMSRFPICIQIYDMPLELWKLGVLDIMSSIFGIPKGIGISTRSKCENGRAAEYASVLVDVGTTRDVVDGISVSYPSGDGYLLSDLRIEYVYSCSLCKVNDHDRSRCSARIAIAEDEAKKFKEALLEQEQEEREYEKRGFESQDTTIKVVDDKAHDTTIKVAIARDQDLVQQIGNDIYFDLVDHGKVWSIRVERQKPFNSVKEEVARELGVPVECQRFWTWSKRQNHTYRPYRPLTRLEETQSVGQLRVVYNKNNSNNAEAELHLFLETVIIDAGLRSLPPPHISEEDILVFFKLYDPDKSQLRYVGSLFVRSCEKPSEIISKLNEKVGFSLDEEIELYEEIKFKRYHEQELDPCVICERLDKRTSFGSSQIRDGDIICFQKLSQGDTYKYPGVPSFLEYVNNHQVVHFRSKDKPNEDGFSLKLSKLCTYNDVAGSVAEKLGVDDSSKIRFTPHNMDLTHPECDSPIEYQAEGNLLDMLGYSNEGYDILYYEVFDIPLLELHMRTLKVAFYHATTTKEEPVIHSIKLPKQSTVGDVLTEINTKVDVSPPDAELRLLQLYSHRIYKVLTPTEKIEDIDDKYWTLRAEKIPEEEKVMGPGDRRIHVYHFIKENRMKVKNFGEPFFMVIREDETLAVVKVRIQRKLKVPDDEFSKWKFAFVCRTSPGYLQDSDIVSTCFQRRAYTDWEPPYLGLEHLEEPAWAGCLK